MKPFVAASQMFLVLFALGQVGAIPQGYGNAASSGKKLSDKKCRLIRDVEYREEYEDVCKTVYERACQTLYREKCSPHYEDKCETVYDDKCDVEKKRECHQDYKTERQPYDDTECDDVYEEECDKIWVTDAYGGKEWANDPNGKCRQVKKTKCVDVVKYRDVRVPYEKCGYKDVKNCYKVPQKKCYQVTTEKCENEPYQDCQKVPRRSCEEVHKRIPHQVERKVCQGEKGYDTKEDEADLDIDGFLDEPVIDVRSKDDEVSFGGDSNKEDDDGVGFAGDSTKKDEEGFVWSG